MLTNLKVLEELERRWRRDRGEEWSFARAQDLYWNLWRHARALRPDWHGGADWQRDLQSEIETLRALHGRCG